MKEICMGGSDYLARVGRLWNKPKETPEEVAKRVQAERKYFIRHVLNPAIKAYEDSQRRGLDRPIGSSLYALSGAA